MVEHSESAGCPFGERLLRAVLDRRTPAIVGLDPRANELPGVLRHELQNGSHLNTARLYQKFCCEVLDVVGPLVPAVKPQAAFFEELGPPGMAALQEVIRYARHLGLLVILDAKRGDIGSTAKAYARAYLVPDAPFAADALTVNPYLGPQTWQPFIEEGCAAGNGIFVLVKTSNPDSGVFQDACLRQGKAVYQLVAEAVQQSAERTRGPFRYGSVGAVVGATYPQQLAELRQAMPAAWILIPGYGAQGGTAQDVAAGFQEDGTGALVNAARHVLFAYQRSPYREKYGEMDWQRAVENAVRDMIEDLAAGTPARRLRSTP
ncbi:MAG: orotidine 5'-phosphate decarboxylase [Pirellulaceae bacterium]|nr:MAG: orotidine 5'-phosphate decarboxylase [Pirellulaceae bacterium]